MGDEVGAGANDSNAVAAGRVGRPHGLDGSFYVTRPVPRLLVLGARVSVGDAEVPIVRRAGTDAQPIVRIEGVTDREGATALRGRELRIDAGAAPVLGDDEYWAHELEGCVVRDGELTVGVVTALLELPSCEALEVRRADGGELLVPMVRDAIRAVDVAARRIDVDMGFLGVSGA